MRIPRSDGLSGRDRRQAGMKITVVRRKWRASSSSLVLLRSDSEEDWEVGRRASLFQPDLAGLGGDPSQFLGTEPAASEGLSHESDHTTHPMVADVFGQGIGIAGQNVERMAQAHQIMIAAHRLPVIGKAVLVLVALMFLDQKAHFDAPTVPGTQIAALMHIVGVQRLLR